VRTALQCVFVWAVLMSASACGGDVVVDRDRGSTGAAEAVPAGVCEEYCNLVHTSDEACRVYEWCINECVEAVTRAEGEGCLEEMVAIYGCWSIGFKETGFCQGGDCQKEFSAYNSCRPQ
jgi:hypothetical protein